MRRYRVRDNAGCPRCGREGWISYLYWGDHAYEDRLTFSHTQFHDEVPTSCTLTGDELVVLLKPETMKLSELQSGRR